MLASTVQFSSYGQNQPTLTTNHTHHPKASKRVMMSGQSQTYDNHTNQKLVRPALKYRTTCVARSLRTQQRAQTTPNTERVPPRQSQRY
jgi:hypothetical protein